MHGKLKVHDVFKKSQTCCLIEELGKILGFAGDKTWKDNWGQGINYVNIILTPEEEWFKYVGGCVWIADCKCLNIVLKK